MLSSVLYQTQWSKKQFLFKERTFKWDLKEEEEGRRERKVHANTLSQRKKDCAFKETEGRWEILEHHEPGKGEVRWDGENKRRLCRTVWATDRGLNVVWENTDSKCPYESKHVGLFSIFGSYDSVLLYSR